MHDPLLKIGAAACALAVLAAYSPAKAVPPSSFAGIAPLVVPVMDQETEAVEEDLRPDVKAPGSEEEEAPEGMAPDHERHEGQTEDVEQEEIERDVIGPGE